jgi:uncharacterized protein (DUF608 family)
MKYTSKDNVHSGLHLGGLGCGTLQVFPDGTRGVFTGQNNWEKPLGQLHWFRPGDGDDYRTNHPFAIFIKKGNKKITRFLQTKGLDNKPAVKNIDFQGDFPIATLDFKDKNLPVKLTLKAYSPFILNDAKNSALPAAIYTFEVKNTNRTAIEASILASCINTNADWNVGRYNRLKRKGNLIGINFLRKHPRPDDDSAGIISLSTNKRQGKVSYFESWQCAKENFKGDLKDFAFDAWDSFSNNGNLPNTNTKKEAYGEGDELMGALAVKVNLRPGESKRIHFYYSWYMPKHYQGHMYANWFKDAFEVASYVDKKKDKLYKDTKKWHKVINDSSMPSWLKDALINNLYVYTSASWWTKKGKFALYENTEKWPLMDSLDVRYYGTLPLAIFFPELEKTTMRMFKGAQRADGRIPHDLGKRQLNCPSDGTTAGKPWKDLSTKYALMVYRDYLWFKDKKFLKEMYPSVKQAMYWQFKTDKNGDYLPDNEAKDSTFDMWEFRGINSYTSSIFLASLLACIKMAEIFEDDKFLKICQKYFINGRKTFEEKLFTGKYYILDYEDDGNIHPQCIAGQLNGQWYAHLLDLGYILPKKSIKKAVKTMLDLNCKASKFGAVNSVYPNKKIDRASYHAENIWAGESYALYSLAIYEGFVKEGLKLTKKMWHHFCYGVKNPYSQPDVMLAKDGRLGDGELYLRNVAIWGVALALAKKRPNLKKSLKKLNKHLF